MQKKQVTIIGAGAAGLFAADAFSTSDEVTIYEKENSIGRKILVAGHGGFNITNNCSGLNLLEKYRPAGWMDRYLEDFGPDKFREYLSELGIPTFVGTSGRVFPIKSISAENVLEKILKRLEDRGVQILTRHTFTGFDEKGNITLMHDEKPLVIHVPALILAMGGASWPLTGSDGKWKQIFEFAGISTKPFQASNCGINIQWPDTISLHAGKPLKNIQIRVKDKKTAGEAMITGYGLEGNAIYPLVPLIRDSLNKKEETFIEIDFKPGITSENLLEKPARQKYGRNYTTAFHLNSAQMAILKSFTTKEEFLSPVKFIQKMKGLKIPVVSLRPVEEAISVVGGVDLSEINENLSLKKYPWIKVIGEMIDWDAPTGGFLLQGCFAMANYAANSYFVLHTS